MHRFLFQIFADNINYQVVIEKGQRIFLPKDPKFLTDECYEQVKKHEVFISNLPHDLLENELLPFLCRVGPVYRIRHIMNFSGSTKGFAYVTFTNVEHAYEAVETLDGELIRKGCDRRVRISFSVDNSRLLLEKVPTDKSEGEFMTELMTKLKGVTGVKIYENGDNSNAMVTFSSHQMASNARRVLVPSGSLIRIFDQKPKAEWAKPKDFKTLFVRFNCSFFNQNLVKDFFENKFDGLKEIKVRNVTIQSRNAFVKFETFSDANFVFKHFKQLDDTAFFVKDYLKIENISWPIRK